MPITFPTETYEFMQRIARKTTRMPVVNPQTKEPIKHPKTGEQLYSSYTGTVEEFIHGCVLGSIVALVSTNQLFQEETGELVKFHQQYGEYISKFIQNKMKEQQALTAAMTNAKTTTG